MLKSKLKTMLASLIKQIIAKPDILKGNIDVSLYPVAPHVWGMKQIFVNLYMIENPADKSWVLVDSGLKFFSKSIYEMAAGLFGEEELPSAIILTHGHFDHIGSVKKLAEEWDVPVYAHRLEMPYLTGMSSYPPPDPSVGGGMMAYMSPVYRSKPIDLGSRIMPLPEDGSVPGLHDWKYIHTPGHTPGHISLYRAKDKVLISGDAFVTTKAESAVSILMQLKKVSRPPAYFTSDWNAARQSVEKLAALNPDTVATGHGHPLKGSKMQASLKRLAENFSDVIPSSGRYVNAPAVADETGVKYIPPRTENDYATPMKILGLVAIGFAAFRVYRRFRK